MLTISIKTTEVATLIVPPVRTANGALAVNIKYSNDSVGFLKNQTNKQNKTNFFPE